MIEECAEKGLLGERFPALIDVAGGGSASDYLMQYIADVSGHTFKRLNLGANHTLGARGAAVAAWMSIYSQGEPLQMALKPESTREFQCISPERRKRYLAWLRMEQDVLNKTLPGHAEIEGE